MGRLLATVMVVLMSARVAGAGGLLIYEVGSSTQGVANNGQAAAARDASTAMLNPAGMQRLERSEFMIAGQALIGDVRFDRNDNTTLEGGDGGNQAIPTLIPTAFFVYDFMDEVKLGAGLASLVGGGLDPRNTWAGRNVTQEITLTTILFNPAVSLQLVDWASLGVGVQIQWARLFDRIGFANPGPMADEGQVKIDADDFAFGFNIGLLIEPREGTRIGLSYRSELQHEFDDDADLGNILGQDGKRNLNVDFPVPQNAVLSVYHQLTPELAVLGDLGWNDWSVFDYTVIAGDEGGAISIPRDWQDTWRIGLGFEYRIADPWLLQAGFSYDSSPVKSRSTNYPDLPSDRQFRYAVGAIHDLNEDMTLGMSYEFVDLGSANVDVTLPRGRIAGDYESNYLHFIAMSLRWKL